MVIQSIARTALSLAALAMFLSSGTAVAENEVLAQPSPAAERLMVVARDFSFEPAYPTINVGARVTWVNRDREAHTVTSDVGLFNAEIGPGERFTFTFEAPGAYFFFCLPHDWMIGEITVDQGV